MSTQIAVRNQPPVPAPDRQKAEVSELLLYWRSIAKRKWAILAAAIAAAVLAAIVAAQMTPVYRASATLMVEQSRSRILSIEEVYSGVAGNREHFETQADILASRAIAARVVDKLGLAQHPEFDPRQVQRSLTQRMLGAVGLGGNPREISDRQVNVLVQNEVMRRTTIQPGRMNQLIRVSFDSPDPQLAATVANALVESYIQGDLERRHSMTGEATDRLEERIAELKKTLEQSERKLQAYRESENIVDVRGVAQSGVARQVEELSRALVDARQRRAEAEAAHRQVAAARGNLESLPVFQRNSLMTRLKELEADAERRHAEASKRYGPNHPRMVEAENDLRQARENTRRQAQTLAHTLTNEYEAARANEGSIAGALAQAKGQIQQMNRKEFQLAALEREVASTRQLYETFLNRYKETTAASDVQSSPVARLTDAAIAPDTPIKPKRNQIVAIAFVLTAFLAVLIAIFMERLHNMLRSPEDVEDKLGQSTLAMLPLVTGVSREHVGRHFLDHPHSLFSEAVRTLRTSVLLSSMSAPKKTILVTSSVSGEGKTTVALNLALAHAQTQRVLLIDADLRKPLVAASLGIDPTRPGLTDLVNGTARFTACLQRVPGSALHVIASGTVPTDALDLLLNPRFKQVIAALAHVCDVLVIDSPPIHMVSDAAVLSTMATGVVFVAKADSVPTHVVRRSIQALQSVDAKLFGVVLNQLDFQKAQRYYGVYTAADPAYYSGPQRLLAYGSRNPQQAARSSTAHPRSMPTRRAAGEAPAPAEGAVAANRTSADPVEGRLAAQWASVSPRSAGEGRASAGGVRGFLRRLWSRVEEHNSPMRPSPRASRR